MRVEEVALADVAARFGTPCYVYSRAALRSAFAAYAEALRGAPHLICYAIKANGNGALLREFRARGAGADVVSGFELLAARRAGFPPDRIVFSGVGKTDEELGLALDTGVFAVNVEGEEEVSRLGRLARARGGEARIALRVNPDIDPRSHPYISTGLARNKFGVEIGTAVDLLERARAAGGVRVVGVQSHIGSQITDLGPMAQAARAVAGLARELLARGFPLESLDVGGGLGVDYEGEGVPGPAALAACVRPVLGDLPLTLVVEPGRSLVAAAGVLLTRVLEVKPGRKRVFAICDAGMNDLVRPALYEAYHRIDPVAPREGPSQVVDVVGPVCESGDFLAQDRALPPLRAGDLLAVRDAGAYGYAMASNYNMRPRPAEVLVDGDEVRLVRRRETFADLVRLEE